MANIEDATGLRKQFYYNGGPMDVRSVLSQNDFDENDGFSYEGMIYYDLDEGQVKIVSEVNAAGEPIKTAQLLSSDSSAQFLTQADKAALEEKIQELEDSGGPSGEKIAMLQNNNAA